MTSASSSSGRVTATSDLVAMRDRLGLAEFVEFTGRVPDETVAAILSSADVGISPDPKNSLNDLCTMNKTMEYMAFGLPVVAFDLRETVVSAAEAARVRHTQRRPRAHQRLLVKLIEDEPRRRAMGAAGRARVEQELAWSHQARALSRVSTCDLVEDGATPRARHRRGCLMGR